MTIIRPARKCQSAHYKFASIGHRNTHFHAELVELVHLAPAEALHLNKHMYTVHLALAGFLLLHHSLGQFQPQIRPLLNTWVRYLACLALHILRQLTWDGVQILHLLLHANHLTRMCIAVHLQKTLRTHSHIALAKLQAHHPCLLHQTRPNPVQQVRIRRIHHRRAQKKTQKNNCRGGPENRQTLIACMRKGGEFRLADLGIFILVLTHVHSSQARSEKSVQDDISDTSMRWSFLRSTN